MQLGVKPPSHVVETKSMLQTERHVVSARLDALDIAINNLELLWPAVRMTPAKPRSVPARRRTKSAVAPRRVAPTKAAGDTSDAAARRELLLDAIVKSEVGLTRGEIQSRFPKMSEQDQRNGLQVLKEKGHIKRAGNSWVKV